MLIKKALLAAAAVMTLAVPAAALAQDFGDHGYHDGFHDDWRGGPRDGFPGEFRDGPPPPPAPVFYERARDFEWRQIEREREIRREIWRARFERHHHWRPYGGFYGYDGVYRPY